MKESQRGVERRKKDNTCARACVQKREREGEEGEEGMELSWKRDAEGETRLGKLGVEGCKESPAWRNGSIECVCKHFPRAFFFACT